MVDTIDMCNNNSLIPTIYINFYEEEKNKGIIPVKPSQKLNIYRLY